MGIAEQDQAVVYRFGKFILDARERVLLADGKPVHLTNKVFDTLLMLVRHNGRLLTKDELLAAIWQDSFVEESNLTKNISRLRKILHNGDTQLIETLPKKGYRFLAEVERLDGDGAFLVHRNLRLRITQTGSDDYDQAKNVVPQVSQLSEVLPTSKPRWKPAFTISVLALLLAVGLYFWTRPHTGVRKIDSKGPVRLTNTPFDEDGAFWTPDDHIIFTRIYSPGNGQTFVIDPDGRGERPTTENAEARSGIWSPDGKRVIFLRKRDGALTAHIANADGSDESELPFLPGPLDWSRDGRFVVFNSSFLDDKDSEIYTFDLEARKLLNISNSPAFEADPAFSPDGRQIVFVSNRDDPKFNSIYVMNSDGTNVRRLTNHPAGAAFPSFSPDGTQIIFGSFRENERSGIYLTDVSGTGPTVRLSDTAYNCEIRTRPFSHDGSRIVFTSDKDGDKLNVYTMSAEPFIPKVLISSEDKDLTAPAVSPDGRSVAYQAKLDDRTGELEIFDVNTATSRTLLHAADFGFSPAWSPAGDLLAISRKDQGNTDICTIRPDGTELRNLTQHPAADITPAWSANGEEIFFASTRERTSAFRLCRMNRDGTEQRPVTGKDGYELTPAASIDGRTLVFSGDRQDGKSKALDIFALDLEHPEQERVLAILRGHDSGPAFSFDGRRIAFVSTQDGNPEIYLINSDGTGLVRLTRDPAEDTDPAFTPDGRRLIFSSNRNGRFAIFDAELPY